MRISPVRSSNLEILMKIHVKFLIICGTLLALCPAAHSQGTAFNYQGRLQNNGVSANGLYDFQFYLFNAPSGGSQVGSTVAVPGVGVTNGFFTTTLDFGTVFTGNATWLAISVRTNGMGNYVGLNPLQQLTPTPYAITAENLASVVENNIIGGGDTVGGGYNNAASNFNSTISGGANNIASGNASTVSGGSENHAISDHAVIGGGQNNVIQDGADHSAISGGNGDTIQTGAFESFIGGGQGNIIKTNSTWSTIGGGLGNSANVSYSFVGGGQNNTASGEFAMVAGGHNNTASGLWATVAGGYGNTVSGDSPTVSGGFENTAGNLGTVPGGSGNNASGILSFAAGNLAQAMHAGAFVWADSQNAAFTSTANNQFLIRAQGGVGINTASPSQQLEVNGEFMMVDGSGGEKAYIGGDGAGNDVQLGSLNPGISAVAFYNAASGSYMHIYCSSITIEGGADLAEPFKIASKNDKVPQGAVVVIDKKNPGQLRMSDQPYDRHVAGVVSGANGINPGIQMQQQGLLEGGRNVALTGRVYVLADAANGPIEAGDLLTTSDTPGHAMKVTDNARAAGAILGKAMTGLSEGKGMVLVLVTLQ
jgi:hypothetical protein